MQLFLLPVSSKRTLIYCNTIKRQPTSKKTYVEKVTTRVGATWVKWESAQSGWQKTITVYGNKLFKRIPFEEWSLKRIPPLSVRRAIENVEGQNDTDVIYPSFMIKPGTVLDLLQKLATERQALHKKFFWGSIIAMPATIPFGLIPILPNLPFFYLAFRAWSHWRALSGSKHIEFLLEKGLIKSTPSNILNKFYAQQVCRLWLPHALAELSGVTLESNQIESHLDNGNQEPQVAKLVLRYQNLESKIHFILRAIDQLSNKNIEGQDLTNLKRVHGPSFLDKISPNIAQVRSDLVAVVHSLEQSRCLLADFTTPGTAARPKEDDMDELTILSEDSGGVLVNWLEEYEVHELKDEVDRAAEQVQKSLAAKVELKSEKEELDSATKASSSEGEFNR